MNGKSKIFMVVLTVWKFNEIEFITVFFFFYPNYPKDFLQYKLHDCLLKSFLFFTQKKDVT